MMRSGGSFRVWACGGVSVLALTLSHAALANPQGGRVAEGAASISASGNKLNIHQTSDKVVIDWRGFDIGKGEHTEFHQPSSSSMALNRVNSANPSQILGKLSANGNVVLVNPNGVFFGKDSKVDVNGLIATTSDISNKDFMAGRLNFNKPGNPDAKVVNRGTITAKQAGLVGLVAPQVENHGVINAKLGRVELASGDRFAVDLYGDGLVELSISDAVRKQLVKNTGTIHAQGGTIALSAADARHIVDSVIEAGGTLNAPSFVQSEGKIIIGGAQKTIVSGRLDVSGKTARGGQISITGKDITITQTASLDASGYADIPLPTSKPGSAALTDDREVRSLEMFLSEEDRGGGSIRIGGDYLGSGDLTHAERVFIQHGSSIKADALEGGDGGRITVWSDDETTFNGNISAQGGSGWGDGGFIETSGKNRLKVGDTARVSTRGPRGTNGLWLLDPQDFTIGAGGDMSAATLQTNLGLGDVSILSSGGGTAGNGDIIINDAFSWSANRLTLTAARDVKVNNVLSATGTAALTVNTATSNGADTSVSGGALKMDLDSSGFNGRIDYAASGSLIINGDTYTIINSLGAAGSTTGTDLQGMQGNLSGKYALGSNIDASATSGWNSGAGWAPVGNGTIKFTGNLNGLGHTINGLTTSRAVTENVGLFGYNNASIIRNIGLTDANFLGLNYTGALIGHAANSSISNSYSTGVVTGNNAYAGGLVGYNSSSVVQDSYSNSAVNGGGVIGGLVGYNLSNSSISASYATGAVTGTSTSGGLVGRNESSSISDSYANGIVSASSDKAGGLVGEAKTNSSISGSYATGSVSGGSGGNTGGLVGQNISSSTISDSYATGNVSGSRDYTGGLVGRHASSGSLVQDSYATGNVSGSGDYTGGLIGRMDTEAVLEDSYATGAVSGSSHTGGLVGRIQEDASISGSHATGNVTASGSTGGLIGSAVSGSVTDSYAEGIINGAGNTGGLIGYINSLTVSGSYATGSVTGTSNNVGGLLGYSTGSSTTNSYATGSVSGSQYTGGLVGYSYGSTITSSYATGSVIGASNFVGGLTGASHTNGAISNSYATGSVNGGGSFVGGLAGYNYNGSTVIGSYATGNVNATGNGVGGLIGINQTNSTISGSYATGSVNGNNNVGGLVGWNDTIVTDSYWNTTTSGKSTSAGGTGKTTAEMMQLSTFSGWDITGSGGGSTVWRIYEGYTAPLLTSFMTDLTVTANDVSKTYDAGNWNAISVTGSGFKTSESLANLSGTLALSGAAATAVNAGAYTITPTGYYSNQQGYDIATVNGTLTINKAPLTVTLTNNALSSYAREAIPSFGLSYSGFVGAENESVLDSAPTASTSATITSDAGDYGINIAGGSDNNYDIQYTNPAGTLTIKVVPSAGSSVEAILPDALSDNETVGEPETPTDTNTGSGLDNGNSGTDTATNDSTDNSTTGNNASSGSHAVGTPSILNLPKTYQMVSQQSSAISVVSTSSVDITSNVNNSNSAGSSDSTNDDIQNIEDVQEGNGMNRGRRKPVTAFGGLLQIHPALVDLLKLDEGKWLN